MAGDPEELSAVKAELDALQAEVQHLKGERTHRTRRVLAAILAVLTVATFLSAVPGAWARRTFFDTERWVATTSPLAHDPAVQAYIAGHITDELFSVLHIQDKVSSALGEVNPNATFLAGPITSAAHDFVYDQVLKVVQNPKFQELWVKAQLKVHDQVIAVLQGKDTGVISLANGEVSLNLLPIINEALSQIQGVATDLVGTSVTLPTITADDIPQEAIDKLSSALGVTLPPDLGNIVVYKSSELADVQAAVYDFNQLVVFLIIAFFVLFIATLAVSTRRRRSLVQMTTAMAVGLVIIRRVAIYSSDHLIAKVKPANQDVARSIADRLMGSLLRYTGWLLAISLLVLLVALLSGPYGWAMSFRSKVARFFFGIGHVLRAAVSSDEEANDWIRPRRDGLMIAGAVIGVLLFLWLNLSFWGVLIFGVLLVGYELVIFRAGREPEAA